MIGYSEKNMSLIFINFNDNTLFIQTTLIGFEYRSVGSD